MEQDKFISFDGTNQTFSEIPKTITQAEIKEKQSSYGCVCGSSEITKTFIESGKWLGSSSSSMRRYSLSDERFKTREYSLGFDFYAKNDMLHTKCNQCGKTDFEQIKTTP